MTVTGVDVELGRAAVALDGAERVALVCHVNPDPDALGSALGLAGFLRNRGKEVVCSWGNEPFEPPAWMAALEWAGFVVPPAEFPSEPGVLVALDTASPDRLGTLAGRAQRAREVIVLDHHRTNAGFGTIAVIDPEASSTAELVFRLVERMGGELP
ncbi:MAG TPA: DHH family phosphoesterase, partial [Actinomycetota bacterium]